MLDHKPQVTLWPVIPIINWVSSDPPSHKFGCAQQHSIIKWKWCIHEWAQAGPEGTSNLCEIVAQMPLTPPPFATLPSLSQPAPKAKGEFPIIIYRERRLKLDLQLIWHNIQAPSKSDGCSTIAPFWDVPEEQWWIETFPVCRTLGSAPNFRQCTWWFPLLGNNQMCNDIQMHGLQSMVWLDGQGLASKIIRKLMAKKFWE